MGRTLKRKALAEALGKDPAQITRWTQRGMPHDVIGGDNFYNAAECAEWISKNVSEKPRGAKAESPTLPLAGAPAATIATPPTPRELNDQERQFVKVLADPEATEVQRAEASYALACLTVSQGYESGKLGTKQLEDLKKQSEELRHVREAYIDLAERSGELISRDVAKAVAGGLAQRVLNILNTVENSIGTQIEIWLADESFRLLGTEERTRQVRQWFEVQARAARDTEAATIDKMIQEQVQERSGE